MSRAYTPATHSPPENGTANRSLTARWNHEELFDNGYVPIPARFLELYAYLKPHPLTPSEAMFVLHLMSFKWTDRLPFPSYQRLAERMNVSDKMVRRYAQSLEAKSYLRRKQRKNNTNLFDLSGLFKALLHATQRLKRLDMTPAELERLTPEELEKLERTWGVSS
jgi:DNA-binding MarR family transcriptional regulator